MKNNGLRFDYCRRFGVEIEVNALDGRSRPVVEGDQPDGIHLVANVVAQRLSTRVEIHEWASVKFHTNNVWMLKLDGSCGMEVCSPVLKGLVGINEVSQVADALDSSPDVKADQRCSLHVHVEVADLSTEDVATILAHWVKCEYSMLLAMPDGRKRNRYCQVIGMSDIFCAENMATPQMILNRLGSYKYYTANVFHLTRGSRPTVEFRIADHLACTNPSYIRNWIKLLIHFVEVCVEAGYPEQYRPGDSETGLLWRKPADMFKFLRFDRPEELCPELAETREWLINRINAHSVSHLGGIWDAQVVRKLWPLQIDA